MVDYRERLNLLKHCIDDRLFVAEVHHIDILAAQVFLLRLAVFLADIFGLMAELFPGGPSGAKAVRTIFVINDDDIFHFLSASIAGSFLPERYSSIALPPVESRSILFSNLVRTITSVVSPPPAMVNALDEAMALAMP